jgi:hypothetical protein
MDESKKQIYSERLEYLVDLMIPLLQECENIYPIIKKWKRTTKITEELSKSWNKVFVIPEPVKKKPVNSGDLVVGKNYIYTPDIYTRQNYRASYTGKMVRLIDIKESSNLQHCDYENIKQCIYLVEWKQSYTGRTWHFYTRKHCLTPMYSY